MGKNSPENFSHPADRTVATIVETPRGSRNKYKWNEESGRLELSKVMPQGMVFPYDFGFFPHTRAEDGDPLDVLILNEEPTFPGCQIDCRLVGVILARQRDKDKKEKTNHRLVAVARASVVYGGVRELTDLEPAHLKQIVDFFVNYQKVREVEVELMGRRDSRAAWKILEQATESRA
jgi:inorganic pyrophosphatase